jgi:Fur family transcriptional regulator, ferric uptake regulator
MTRGSTDRATTIDVVTTANANEWVSHALGSFARAGYRSGGARRTVIEALGRHDCAVTALELEDDLRRRGTTVARASIYRALEQLEDLGLLHRLEIGQGRSSFERAEPSGLHHHHLVCERCGRVDPFADSGLERVISRVSEDASFRVREHDVVLRGLCPRCS